MPAATPWGAPWGGPWSASWDELEADWERATMGTMGTMASVRQQYSPAPSSRRLSRTSGRPRQRGTPTSTSATTAPPSAAPSPATGAAVPVAAAALNASAVNLTTAAAVAAPAAGPLGPQPGTLRRGRSLDVICEEVLGEAPLLTNPVRRRRSELIPRARLIPRRAASETRADSRTRCRVVDPSPTPSSAARGPPCTGVRRCSSARGEEWGAGAFWRPISANAARRSNSLCCSPVTRTPERLFRTPSTHSAHSAARRSHSVRDARDGLHGSPYGSQHGLQGLLCDGQGSTTPGQGQRCSRSNSYRCPAPSPFRDRPEDQVDEQPAPTTSTTAAAVAAAVAATVAAKAATMTRRPQVLRVTDSATTGSRRQQVSQAVTPPQITSPEDESPRSSPHRSPSDSPQASPRSSGSPLPSSPGSDQQQTYVSQSSVTLRGLRGVPVYDEYLCADHRWVRSTDGKGRRRHSESEEDLGGGSAGGTSSSSGGSNSSCGSSYVTWTKSSLSSKQWQLMRSTSTPASAATQPAASRILKEDGGELMEGGGEEGCVAVLAPCPTTPTTPAVGLVTLAAKATKPPRDPQSRKPEQKRHQRHHSEFDGLLQYLQDYRHGLRELLVNNNVVIIEPVRASMRHGDDRRAHSAPVDDHHNDDKTCRITGAIVKSMSASETDGVPGVRVTSSNNTLPRSQKPHQPILRRQFFYHPIKINKELVDAELPDPDTVRNARKVFERAQRAQRAAPKTSLGLSGLTGLSHSHSGLDKRTCWTDSGSLSSGVSSDLSCCDLSTSCDTDLRTGTCSSGSQLSQREVFSSGDESEPDQPHQHTTTQVQMRAVETAVPGGGSDGNPVSEDVLQKIRACGTTVTYFGGEVISCSGAGPARSPMTMAIMEEIRRSARPLVGIKFRLVKSNSCGSRLELAGQTGGARWKRTAPAATPDLFQTPAATPDTFKPPAATPDTFRAPAATPDLFKAPAEDSPRTRRVSAECVAEREEEVVVIETKDTVRDEEPRDAKVDGDVQNGDTRGDNAPKAPNAVDTRNTRTKEVVKEVINDKENRPALGPASWRLSGKSKRAVAALPLPRPQQPDKFGVMEFEEFQFIET